jgi:hypothetical protein
LLARKVAPGCEFGKNYLTFYLIEPTIENAPLQNTVSHPRLGALKAKEWFTLVEMHYRHHLQQKDSLKKNLENKK